VAALTVESPSAHDTLTLQDLVDRLGGIPLSRILARPAPGTATESDLIRINGAKQRICELVDGVLVEKGMGYRESLLAMALGDLLRAFVIPRNLGLVTGESATLALFPGLVRAPDVAFVSWSRLPGGVVPGAPVPGVAPDLAVEVLSKSNTKAEMKRKRAQYFKAGVDLVWEVDPESRTVIVYDRDEKKPRVYDASQTIECRRALSGFQLILSELFSELDRRQNDTEKA
jgi:Uma2 family endonuclease